MAGSLPKYLEITQTSGISIAQFLKENRFSKTFVLVDENTKRNCLPLIEEYLGKHVLIEIRSGETNKTLDTCKTIWQALTDEEADRKSLLVNLGGGVIGDMGGFCASTYKRGIDFVNIPTTLLSQVDASLGGKLGVDFGGLKNHIGLFRLPKKVIIDTWFLTTLPDEEIRSGFAEILKHAFIKDVNYMKQLEKLDLANCQWEPLVKRSIQIKHEIVESDPNETGKRKLLNFGHTIGHALETSFLNNKRPVLHGEAVAAGMIAEAYLSTKYTGLEITQRDTLIQLIDYYFNRIEVSETTLKEALINIEQDKKNEGKAIQAALLIELGKANHSITISKEDVIEALSFYSII